MKQEKTEDLRNQMKETDDVVSKDEGIGSTFVGSTLDRQATEPASESIDIPVKTAETAGGDATSKQEDGTAAIVYGSVTTGESLGTKEPANENILLQGAARSGKTNLIETQNRTGLIMQEAKVSIIFLMAGFRY